MPRAHLPRTAAAGALLAATALAGCSMADTGPVTEQRATRAPTATNANASTVFLVECVPGSRVSRPQTFILGCASADSRLEELTWNAWGDERATATGVLVENDCEPSCSQGHEISYPVRVTASARAWGQTLGTYRALTVTFTGSRPKGSNQVETYDLLGPDDATSDAVSSPTG